MVNPVLAGERTAGGEAGVVERPELVEGGALGFDRETAAKFLEGFDLAILAILAASVRGAR